MKRLFLICFLSLATAGMITRLTEPDMGSEVPVIYWATDANPARIEQVDKFHKWFQSRKVRVQRVFDVVQMLDGLD